jgi:hypothetical protein
MCIEKLPKALWPWVVIKKNLYNKLTKFLFYSKITL